MDMSKLNSPDSSFMHAYRTPPAHRTRSTTVAMRTPPTMTKHRPKAKAKLKFPRKRDLPMKGVKSRKAPKQLGSKLSRDGWETVLTAMAGQMRPSAYVGDANHEIFYRPLVTGGTKDDQDMGQCMRPKARPRPPFYYAEDRLQYLVPTTNQVIRCHVVICFATHGKPNEGDEAMHKLKDCRFDDCLNPLHLSWGTKSENHQDHLRGPRRLGKRKEPSPSKKGTSKAKHSKVVHSTAGPARVREDTEVRRMGPSQTTKVTRSASSTVQGVMTRAKAKPK
jgi:hypothetical protein